jgi:hypothetical protein
MGRDRSKIDPDLKAPVPLRKNSGRPPDPNRKCPVEVRVCQRHGNTEFAYYSAGPARGHRWKCKRCVGEAVTRRLQKVKRTLVAEAGGCCHGEIEAGMIESPSAGAKHQGGLNAA